MSDIDMATTGDINRAKAHADKGDENLQLQITDLKTKVDDLQKNNAELQKIVGKLQKDNAELREALQAAGISVGTKKE